MELGLNMGESKMSKRKNKKNQIIIGILFAFVLLALVLCGANTEILNQFSKMTGLNIVRVGLCNTEHIHMKTI